MKYAIVAIAGLISGCETLQARPPVDYFATCTQIGLEPNTPAHSGCMLGVYESHKKSKGAAYKGTTAPVGHRMQSTFMPGYQEDAYGLGVHSDAYGQAFQWRTEDGRVVDPGTSVTPDVYGPGLGMDQYGRPVRATRY